MATEVTKQLAGVEDLLFSLTNTTQNRQEGASIVSKIVSGINSGVIPYNTLRTIKEQLDFMVESGTGSGSTIHYGIVNPTATYNPANGINAFYYNTVSNELFICTDATPDSNVWDEISGGQFLGDAPTKAVQYMSPTTSENLILGEVNEENGFAIDSLTIANGGSLTISNGSVFKVL